MSKITLVTAFFDIGREKFKSIPRSNDKYMENFRFWARIRNDLIIYTTKEHEKQIYEIRKSFGLESKTHLIILDDIYKICSKVYNNICEVANNQHFRNFRLIQDATSNNAEYDYIMLLKSWCLKDSVNRGLTSDIVAWIDFGFNHGGKVFTNCEEFDFEWEYEFEEKIHLYYLNNIDERPIFEIVRQFTDCIMGCLMIVPAKLCKEFYELNFESMNILNEVGLVDDDQLILLMSYRRKKNIFKLEKSDWFLPLKEYGGNHLKVNNSKNMKRKLKDRISNFINRKIRLIRYLKITYETLKNI